MELVRTILIFMLFISMRPQLILIIDAIHIYEATIGVDAIYIGGIRGPDLPERARDLGVVGLVDS